MTMANPGRRMPLPSRPRNVGGRPVGEVGEVSRAMLAEAARAPGTARELSRRACVGDRVGMYTASRLASSGLLVKVLNSRPAVYAARDCSSVSLLSERTCESGAALGALGALLALPFVGGLGAVEAA